MPDREPWIGPYKSELYIQASMTRDCSSSRGPTQRRAPTDDQVGHWKPEHIYYPI